MGADVSGSNPQRKSGEPELPARGFRIIYIDPRGGRRVVEVDPARIPYNPHGRPGSLLEIALGHGIEIEHACGGVCACGTCHVVVREGHESCSQPSDEEQDELDQAYGVTSRSRLACQCVPDGTRDLVVEIPTRNRNLER